MLNFLALLGWGTGSDDELFTRDELVQRFNLEGISGGNAVFNTEKLDWFNHQHLLRLSDKELIKRLEGLGLEGLGPKGLGLEGLGLEGLQADARMSAILNLLRPRCKRLIDFSDQLRPFVEDPSSYDPEAVKKHLSMPGTKEHLLALSDVYATAEWNEASIEKSLRDLADARKVKAGMLIHGTRIAMTGRMVSPGLFEMLVILERETVLRRMARFAAIL